ncbi:MAG TPA: hypothetical protein VGB08_11180 [Allosphingosinicella sp.]|jgi:hypothetical protein
MDHAFFLRAERMLAREPVGIDYGMLVASLAAHQSASATARAARECRRAGGFARSDALAELLAGGPAWRSARRAQRGSFRRAAAFGAFGREA